MCFLSEPSDKGIVEGRLSMTLYLNHKLYLNTSMIIYIINDLEFPLLLLVSDWPRRHLLECTSE